MLRSEEAVLILYVRWICFGPNVPARRKNFIKK
jgi:hypothetical protein